MGIEALQRVAVCEQTDDVRLNGPMLRVGLDEGILRRLSVGAIDVLLVFGDQFLAL